MAGGSGIGTPTVAGDKLASLDAVKIALHITTTDEDAFLTSLLLAATDAIQRFCKRMFFWGVYTEYYDGDGSPYLRLIQYPVDSTQTKVIKVGTSLTSESDWTTIVVKTDYEIDYISGIVFYPAGFPEDFKNIYASYTGGYRTLPYDLVQVCIDLVVQMYNLSKKGAGVFKSERIGRYAYVLADKVLFESPMLVSRLSVFRRIEI